MPSELSKLMRQYGVTSASMALPAQFKGTTVAKPTAPDEPVAPENTFGDKPVIKNYDALNPKWTTLPTATNQKTVTGDALKTAQDQWNQYQKDLADWNIKNDAYQKELKDYTAYSGGTSGGALLNPPKDTYAAKQAAYLVEQKKYEKYLKDKEAFDSDAGSGGAYKAYKDAYQDRIMQTPMYLREQFTRGVTENPYKNLYSPYGSIDTYNKIGTFWDSPIGEPDYKNNAAYSPYDNTKTTVSSSWLDDTLNDSLPGGNKVDTLVAGDKNDVIVDTLVAGDGNDVIVDTLVAGDGNDVIEETWWSKLKYPDLASAMADGYNIYGVKINKNDTLLGSNGVDTLIGSKGDDTIPGGDVTVVNPNANTWWFKAGYPDLDTAMMKTGLDENGNPKSIVDIFPKTDVSVTPSLTDLAIKNGINPITSNPSVYAPPIGPVYNEQNAAKAQEATLAAQQGQSITGVSSQPLIYNPPVGPYYNEQDQARSQQNALAAQQGKIINEVSSQPVAYTSPIGPFYNVQDQARSQQGANMNGVSVDNPWLINNIGTWNTQPMTYAKGGSVHHLARKYAVGGGPVPQGGTSIANSAMPNPEKGIPQPVEAPAPVVVPQIQPSDSMAQMQEMLKAYATPSNDYAQELEEARRKSNAETEAFMSMIQKSKKPENDNLSQAELYFRLAAAAGAPTKTGSFTESLSNINKEMADYSKDQTGRRNADLELQMKAQQLKAANAKEDLNVLRGLAGESMKDKRALISEMIKAEIPKAQSEAGKLALDMGLKVGTPDYQKFVTTNGMQLLKAKVNQMIMGPAIASQNAATSSAQLGVAQGNLAENQARTGLEIEKWQEKQNENKKLTPKELDIKWGKEDTLNNLKNAQKMIEQAYDLNNVAYTGNVFDVAKQKYGEVFSPEDPTVVNTGKLVNLLSAESLSRMKDVFGSNPTEGERAAQAQLSGALAKSKEVRKDIMLNYMEQLQKRIALEEKRLKQLDEGKSRDLPSKEEAQ